MRWFLLLLWCACGTAHSQSLTLWHAYRGDERTALESLLTQYSETHPGVTVVPRAIPFDGFNAKLEAAVPRGHGPDLFIAAHERLGTWVPLGLVRTNPTAMVDVSPTVEQALFHEGSAYGLPMAFKTLVLFYNKARVEVPPHSTDALIALATRERDAGRIGLAYQATEPFFHAPWMHGYNGGLMHKGEVRMDRPGAIEALTFAKRLSDEGLVPEEPTSALVTQLFNDGQAAMVINGPWFLGEVDPQIDLGVAPLPIVSATGQAAAPYLTVEAIQVSAHSGHPHVAWAIAQWLTSTDQAVSRAIYGRQSVATSTAYDDPRIAEDPVLMAFHEQLEHTQPMNSGVWMGASWEPLARAIRRVMRGAQTPQEALAAADQEFRVVTAPPPPAANPWPYMILAAMLALGACTVVFRSAWRQRSSIRTMAHAYRWIAPAAVSMGILVIVPFIVGGAVSLFAHRDGSWTFVGITHFLDILFARDWPLTSALSFWFTLAVTVMWTTANILLHVSIGITLAMFLRAPWLQLKGIYRVLLILPWAIPNYITALIWKGMFHRQFGAINSLLGVLGIEPVSWFSQFSTAFAANLITNTWLGFPFMMVVTLGALQAIPGDVEEAASIDGASGWQRFWWVTWPMLKPALLPAIVLGSIWTFNMFNIIYLVSGGEPDGGTEILISEAYRWAFTRGHRYGYAAAYAVLIFGVLLIYSKATDRILTRKAT